MRPAFGERPGFRRASAQAPSSGPPASRVQEAVRQTASRSRARARLRSCARPIRSCARPACGRATSLCRRALAARQSGVFLQLVGAVERRDVGRRGEAGADAETVDRRLRREQASDASSSRPPLAKIDLGQSTLLQDGAHAFDRPARSPLSMRTARMVMPRGGKLWRQRHHFMRRRLAVVGVEQEVRFRAGRGRTARTRSPRRHGPR